MIRGIHTYSVRMKANKARIYLENISLMDANFLPGTPIEVASEEDREIVRFSNRYFVFFVLCPYNQVYDRMEINSQ